MEVIFNNKCIEQLAWRGYEQYRDCVASPGTNSVFPHFNELGKEKREAWIEATKLILELAVMEVKNKLEL